MWEMIIADMRSRARQAYAEASRRSMDREAAPAMLTRIRTSLPEDLEWRMAGLLPAPLVDLLGRVPGLRARTARLHETAGRLRRAAALAARGMPKVEPLTRRL